LGTAVRKQLTSGADDNLACALATATTHNAQLLDNDRPALTNDLPDAPANQLPGNNNDLHPCLGIVVAH
jgi:hypothetical protein